MNNWKLILSISKTHLLSKFKQTATASLGVTFGIGAYITLVCFMTGMNKMLDDLILNQTPHIHIYNEIKASKRQPINLLKEFSESIHLIHSIKPKQSQKKIPNALPILKLLNGDERVKKALPQLKTQIFYIAGSIELGGNLTGVDILDEANFFNIHDYIVQGTPETLYSNINGILLGIGIAKKNVVKSRR